MSDSDKTLLESYSVGLKAARGCLPTANLCETSSARFCLFLSEFHPEMISGCKAKKMRHLCDEGKDITLLKMARDDRRCV